MTRFVATWVWVLLLSVVQVTSSGAASGAPGDAWLPADLQPWRAWVLHGNETVQCPFFFNDDKQRQCAWPGRLDLAVEAQSARFAFDLHVYARSWIELPGDAEYWPQDVVANGKPLVVVKKNGQPQAQLASGTYRISGVLRWENRPEFLSLGAAGTLVVLTVDGRAQVPVIDQQGRLWFSRKQAAAPVSATRNTAVVRVFRRLVDGIPPMLSTRLEIDIAGDDRELLLGRALPDGFVPVALAGGLPARLEKNGDLRLQVRPGSWVVLLEARQAAVAQDYRMVGRAEAADQLWPSQEVWTFLADRSLRTVRLDGAPAVDPKQTGLPQEWQALPTYLLTPKVELKLTELARGDAHPQPEPLTLTREFWLDFDGKALTARDRLHGDLARSGRLIFADGVLPGRVLLNGEPQVITSLAKLPDASATADMNAVPLQIGIEVRPGPLAVEAITRVALSGPVAAGGWARDMQQLSATLQLPPGWRLFAAGGVDHASPAWLSDWTLWDIFLVLVIVVSAARLTNRRIGALMLVTLLMTHAVAGAPLLLWLNLVAVLAVWHALPVGRARIVVGVYRGVSVGVLAVVAVMFAVDQVRQGLYPELEYPWRNIHESPMALSSHIASAPADEFVNEEMRDRAVMEKGRSEVDGPALAVSRGIAKTLVSGGALREQKYAQLDEGVLVQTGPGVPDWSWHAVQLRWDGPVAQTQQLDLWLIGPLTNRLLCFLRVAGVALLMWALWRGSLPSWRLPWRGAAASALAVSLLAGLLVMPQPTLAADLPDAALLDELRTRLLAAPDCLPDCAAIERAHVELFGERIVLRLRVAAAAKVAVPLPSAGVAWRARSVLVDGVPATLRVHKEQAVVALAPGVHDVVMEGSSTGIDTLQFVFPLRPGRITANTVGWQVSGMVDGRLPGGSLELLRVASGSSADKRGQPSDKGLPGEPAPLFVIVERTLRFDIDWHLDTRIIRVAPQQAPLSVAVPLVAGETVTSRVNVKDGKVLVDLAQDQRDYRWRSVLKPVPVLALYAAPDVPWVERWLLDASTRWHADAEGLPPVKGAGGLRWLPWPGEKLRLHVTRPLPVAGDTLTIEQARLQHRPGHRTAESTLTLNLLSSQGGEYRFRLPAQTVLEALTVDGEPQVIAGDGSEAIVPLHPGKQSAEIRWRSETGMGVLARTPLIDLGRVASNLDVELEVPATRWPLLVGGPGAGPAVLYWGMLVVVILIGVALARVPHSPLKTYEWVLLGMGMSSTMLPWSALVASWFFIVAFRARANPQAVSVGVFNFLQIMLALLTVFAMVVLLFTIPQSLVLGTPEMQITGNGSHAAWLHWFVDHTTGVLPQGWLVSLPMWVYRLAMLAWSLWLALALTRWLRWAWQCYATNGLWRTAASTHGNDSAAS